MAKEIYCVSFGWFLSWRLSHCFEFSLFLLFSKHVDLWPALWRYSLCFSSLMLFSWLSMFLFEELWLMMFISLNLTSESVYLSLLQIDWESEVLHISRKSHISSSILSLFFFWVLLLRNLLIMSFFEQSSVLRDSISFWSVAIILLPTRHWYSSLLYRSNFCFSSFCINSFTSFFMFRSKILHCMKISRHENFGVSRSSSKNREIKMPRKMHFELNREIKMPRKKF